MTHGAAIAVVMTADGRTVIGRRRADLAFLGGFTVFPGGSVDALDHARGQALGPDGALRHAALRELWEETGLVVRGTHAVPAPSGLAFEALYDDAALAAAAARLTFLARWVTPSFSPIRFDTTCYALGVDEAEPPPGGQGELEVVRLDTPSVLLAAWRRHELMLAPPTWQALLALEAGLLGAAERLRGADGTDGEDVYYFECVPGIRGVPLLTPTLPPATHTNTYLVGTERLIVVDPATYDEAERAKLWLELERLGRPVEAIVLTHHHGDHVGSARWLSERTGAPITAHPITRELLAPRVEVTRTIDEGDTLQLGSPEAPFPIHVTFTPGHARGHVVLSDGRPHGRAHLVGDMVASVGTIVIDPPDGDMAEYLRQLRRLIGYGPSILFPAHGMPILDGVAKLEQYIAHRLGREAKVRAALEAHGGTATAGELLPRAYADTPEFLWPLAERSCLAHLLKLVHDGAATATSGERFEARAG
jgi:ribonuclease/clavin/mitogillin